MPFLTDLFSGGPSGAPYARRAYQQQIGGIGQAAGQLTDAEKQAIATEQKAQTNALSALLGGQGQAVGAYTQGMAPWETIASQFSGAGPTYMGALGVGSPQDVAAARGSFQASPWYQYTLGQGLEGLARTGASTGQLGQTNMDAMKFAQNLSDQDYQNWLQNLFQGVGVQENAARGIQQGFGDIGSAYLKGGAGAADIYTGTGQDIARSQLGLGTGLAELARGKGQAGATLQQQLYGDKATRFGNTLNELFGGAGLALGGLTGGLGGAGIGSSLASLFGGSNAPTDPGYPTNMSYYMNPDEPIY